ncbi:MAG: hypothetical protein GY714_20065 [Desulfobacterales bacterium]|nr:hypothetical protein [Desulfobacterales bacterium]
MAKKETTTTDENENYADEAEQSGDEVLAGMDFNVDDEYKPDPLIPKGNYHGNVTNVSVNAAQKCIIWDICLHDNGGVMNDDETPIDGAHVWFRNWLPRAGDENTLTKSGKHSKRQSKINMLNDFSKELDIDMSTPQKIAESIQDAVWIGLEVSAEVDIDEYQGKFRNVANRLRKSTSF